MALFPSQVVFYLLSKNIYDGKREGKDDFINHLRRFLLDGGGGEGSPEPTWSMGS
jgi:hypothetical protein